MARPRKDPRDLKHPKCLSLTLRQQATLQKLGGGQWVSTLLQQIGDGDIPPPKLKKKESSM